MIFVTVGTNEARFDRLLEAIDGLAGDEECVVQHGPSPVRPARATCLDYMPFDELLAEVRRARVVVMHAGVGSMMASLTNGKRPVVVPRLARHHEAVDDHQVPLARRLAAAGLVVLVEDLATLATAISADGEATAIPVGVSTPLSDDLRAFLLELTGYSR